MGPCLGNSIRHPEFPPVPYRHKAAAWQYRPEEWIRLEQLYEEMMGSYDIQTAGHIDTLKLMCKTSLKANQLLDIGDVDGA